MLEGIRGDTPRLTVEQIGLWRLATLISRPGKSRDTNDSFVIPQLPQPRFGIKSAKIIIKALVTKR